MVKPSGKKRRKSAPAPGAGGPARRTSPAPQADKPAPPAVPAAGAGNAAPAPARERIKTAAAEEFIEKGLEGARMQAIADRAGVNKALIHYYFHSKEALFEAIVRETFEEMFRQFTKLRLSYKDFDPEVLIPRLVHTHMRFLVEHPQLPKLLAREMHAGHPIARRVLKDILKKLRRGRFFDLTHVLRAAALSGRIRRVDPEQTIWNLVGLNLFLFIARPMLEAGWPDLFRDEEKLFARREKAVADLFLYGILPRK